MTRTETQRPRRHRRPARATVTALVVATLAVATVAMMTGASAGATASGTGTSTTASTAAANAAPSTSTATVAAATTTTYGVGVLTVTLVDPTRPTAARGSTPASSSRTLTVTIRYPTSTSTAGSTETTAATPASGSFPLVVFVHGYDTSAATYADMEHDLAAAGFVVAAPDFPLSSSALDGTAVRDAVEQAADVSFVITTLTNGTEVPTLARTISTGKVAVVGHSDGGITAAGVAFDSDYADSRIAAAVVLSGAETAFPGNWFTTTGPALLAIHGTDDEVNPYSSSEQLYDDATGAKVLVSVEGGGHLGPFTTDPVRSQVDTLIADFLHAQLQGSSAAAARVGADANVAGALTLAARA